MSANPIPQPDEQWKLARYADKVVLVTGAGSGLGEGIAKRFAEEGARVCIADRDEAGGARVAAEIGAADKLASFVAADISRAEGAEHAVSTAVERYGQLDVLVNNAGVSFGDGWDATEQHWDRVLGVNLKGQFLCARSAIPELRKTHGNIINVASVAGEICCAPAHYSASKGGSVMLTKALATELAPDGIRVNAIGPGLMVTPMTDGSRSGESEAAVRERLDEFASRVPMGRCGYPLDVANAALFLASQEAAYITGQHLCVDGGFASAK